jgi:hypothetical protein
MELFVVVYELQWVQWIVELFVSRNPALENIDLPAIDQCNTLALSIEQCSTLVLPTKEMNAIPIN